MIGKIFFLIFFSLCVISNSIAQKKAIEIKQYSAEDGLSDNQITSIIRDKLGYIWIGTKDGLNRFDGKQFHVFKQKLNDRKSICGNNITCLAYDSDSLLWIGTYSNGFCSYNTKTGHFTTYNIQNSNLLSNSINAITVHENKLWIAQNSYGIQTFDLINKNIKSEYKDIPKNTYYDIAFKNNIPYFAGIVESLKTAENLGKFKTVVPINGRTLNKIYVATNGRIWCGAWDNGLHEFNDKAELINTFFFDSSSKLNVSGDEIISITEDANNILWCGTKFSGIHFFDIKQNKFKEPFQFSKLINSRINCLYKDDRDRIWIGSEQGMFVYDPLKNQFKVVKLQNSNFTKACKVIDRIISKSKTEYIITSCGLYYKKIDENKYTFKDIIYNGEKQQLTSILEDHKSRIFIGTNKTVLLLDTISFTTNIIKTQIKDKSSNFYSAYSSRVNWLKEIKIGNTYFIAASYYGHNITLIQYDKQLIYDIYQKESKSDYLENLTRKLYIDSKERLWICGAVKGVIEIIKPKNIAFVTPVDTIEIIRIDYNSWKNKKVGNFFSVGDVYDIIENTDNSFWLTTQGSGLVQFYPENKSSSFLSIPGKYKSLQGIAKSNDGDLWIISSVGLINYNVKNKIYKLYDKKDGIPTGLSGYFFQNKSDILSAGFDGGYVSFNPKMLKKDSEKPNIHVSSLWIMDIPSDSLLHSNLKLNYRNNFIKFYISSNCFSNNEQVTYKYQLVGIDKEWRDNQNNPLITYTNLPPGAFTLKTKAINSDGVESEIFYLALKITPPFYDTLYFKFGLLILITSLIYGFYRYRINEIYKIQAVRNKIARDLHDDIGSTLGSINLYSQIANAQIGKLKDYELKDILIKIGKSSSEIIDKTGDAIWAVKASNDSLKELILRIESYAASLLGTANINFTINFNDEILSNKLEMSKRKNIFLIFKESIYNIVKYADATEVTISINQIAGKLKFVIKDNGKGFEMQKIKPYNGNGIKNMEIRAKEINGFLNVKSSLENGTIVTLEL